MHVFEEPTPAPADGITWYTTPADGMADDTQDVLASDTIDIDDAVVLDAVDGARSDAPNDVIEPEWHHHHHDDPQGPSYPYLMSAHSLRVISPATRFV